MNKNEGTKRKQAKLSLERLTDLIDYNPETGIFLNKKRRGNAMPGIEAGYIEPRGYRSILIDRERYWAHRLAWFYMFKYWPADQIDHINRNKSDNRISNLREATNYINNSNKEIRAEKISSIKGIVWRPDSQDWEVKYNDKYLCRAKTIDDGKRFIKEYSLGIFKHPQRIGAAQKQSDVVGINWIEKRNKWYVVKNGKFLGYASTIKEGRKLQEKYLKAREKKAA